MRNKREPLGRPQGYPNYFRYYDSSNYMKEKILHPRVQMRARMQWPQVQVVLLVEKERRIY